MEIVVFQIMGVAIFLASTVVAGFKLRDNTDVEYVKNLSRVTHGFFWFFLVLPELIGIVYPGLYAFDALIGMPSLGSVPMIDVVGWLVFLGGMYFLSASGSALREIGAGYAAFKLTKNLVSVRVYKLSRNPMSLGYYLWYLGASLIVGSSYLLLLTFAVIVVHVFYLLYFEERELRIRYGESYENYGRDVPFLIPRVPGFRKV